MTNLELTEMWQDGKLNEVTAHILDSKDFMAKDRLIDFCVYFSKYLGLKELQVLQKLT